MVGGVGGLIQPPAIRRPSFPLHLITNFTPSCVGCAIESTYTGKYSTLILQHLIDDDIRHYVEEKLYCDSFMERLNCVQCGATSHFIERPTPKANVVLLWERFVGTGPFLFYHPQGQASVIGL